MSPKYVRSLESRHRSILLFLLKPNALGPVIRHAP